MTAGPPDAAALADLVRSGQLEEFVARAAQLEPADLADVLASLDDEQRLAVVQLLPTDLSGQALVEMSDDAHPEETLAALPPSTAAEIVQALDDDDAADLLGELEPADQQRILAGVEDRAEVERLLRYDEETAGGRMTAAVVTVVDTATVGEALEEIRRQAELVEDFYQIFVVDGARRFQGVLPLKDLVTSRPDRPVRAFMADAELSVPPEMDQEQVARVMSRYNVPSVPVVDAAGVLLGRVTFDDVTDVVEAEATEDLLQFGGTSPDEPIAAGSGEAVRSRLPWLVINLFTAFAAAWVVNRFLGLIAALPVLAVVMPIIAGMGGNAGTQALAVTVRRLALRLISPRQVLGVIVKEIVVGAINGVAIGVIVALGAVVVGLPPRLGLVVFLAMTGNLIVAGFAGAFIPLALERVGVDPAIASSIIVTTFTDVCGFALLLGLAGALLL